MDLVDQVDQVEQADQAADFEAEPAAATAMEPAAAAPDPERSLDQMQRELAVNEAKLRALGVSLPEAEDGSIAPPTDAKPSGGFAPPPSSTPPHSGGGDGIGSKQKDAKQKKPSRREHEKWTIEPHRAPQPDEAKAAPLSPNTETREQDAAGRCLMICDLSQVTCELNTQICELADRHDQDDYRAACERAAEDCEVAREACDVCVG
jgi:hypothetical protein